MNFISWFIFGSPTANCVEAKTFPKDNKMLLAETKHIQLFLLEGLNNRQKSRPGSLLPIKYL